MVSLFGHDVRSELVLLYAIEALACFVGIALLLTLGADAATRPEPVAIVAFAGLLAFLSGPLAGAGGLYQTETWSRGGRLMAGLLIAGIMLLPLALLVATAVGSGVPDGATWRTLCAVDATAISAVLLTRLGFAYAIHHGMFARRVAVLQDGGAAIDLGQSGIARDPQRVVLNISAADAASAVTADTLRARRVWGVVVADGVSLPHGVRDACRAASARVFLESEFRERQSGRVELNRLPADWLDRSNAARENRVEAVIRRVFDVLVAGLLLLVTLPLLLITALAIKIDSHGPVFYRQERVGLHGRPFRLIKFRSMRSDAEAAGAPQWATKGDSRVTRVGRFIRLTRIDEIPQVLNVLRGDMAFVGPRPERPEFVAQLAQAIPHYHDRAVVKPGITGWAQVNFPYGASVEDARAKLTYDLYYVRRRSLFLDFLILVATVRVVVFQEGSR